MSRLELSYRWEGLGVLHRTTPSHLTSHIAPGYWRRPSGGYSLLATTQGSRDIQSASGAKRNTIAPWASLGRSFCARCGSIAGHPSLRPALSALTYGAPCATTPRLSALL